MAKSKSTAAAKVTAKTAKTETAEKKTVSAEKSTLDVIVEYNHEQIDTAAISKLAIEDYKAKGNKDDVKSVKLYVIPEKSAAYYVINDKASEDYKINL